MSIKTTLGSVLFCACFALSSCGGSGGGGGGGGNGGGNADTTAPSGYSVSLSTDPIDETNEANVAFSVAGAEVGATYEYSLTLGSSELGGNGTVAQASFDIDGLDLSSFPSGTVELELRLTDSSGNEGSVVSDSASKTSVPVGGPLVLVNFLTDPINDANETDVGFSVTGAEVNTGYSYRLSSAASEISGNGEVTQSDFEITGLDLSSFPNGEILLEVTLENASGTLNFTVSDTAVKSSSISLSGTVTYAFVPHKDVFLGQFGLDYAAIEARAVRGATVQILDDSLTVIASTQTDESGQYSLDLDPEQDVQVRVRAELLETGTASWDFSVTDNTNGNAIYVLDGSLVALGVEDQTRDLHAPSGWGFPGYTSERAAAPFAILDTVYQIVEKFVEIDADIQFPEAEFRWSENNVPEEGDIEVGQITTSSYRSNGITGNVYILGAEDSDTDEYDPHVIVHEWGHYFEDRLSRSDSVGGAHDLDSQLDMRVAFGEGWGNALSAMILDDSIYIDTGGAAQESAGGFDLELNEGFSSPTTNFDPAIGWYSEFSVQSILYDLYDTDADGADNISLGLEPIYAVLTDDDYRDQGTVTAIFSFLAQLREDNAGEVAGIDALATAQDISGTGYEGVGETNDAGVGDVLPVYHSATVNGASVEVCTDNSFGEYNRLDNRRFVLTTLPSAGTYSFSVDRVSGLSDADPEIRIIGPLQSFGGEVIRFSCGDSDTGTTEAMGCSGLLAGEHVLEIYDAGNVDNLVDPDDTGGEVCFDVTVTD